jgi:lipopolysaccharide transport system permease protein
MVILFKQILERKSALRTLVTSNLINSIESTRFGILWWVIDPLTNMIIYYYLVNMIFQRGEDNYHIFLLCGIVCNQFFSASLIGCTNTLIVNTNLIKQSDLQKEIYILIDPLIQSVHCCFGILIIVAFAPHKIGMHFFAVLPIILLLIIITSAIGMFLSITNVYYRDTANFVRYGLRFLFFLSPIMYGPERVLKSHLPGIVKKIYYVNPMASIIPWFRSVLQYGELYDLRNYLIVTTISLVVFELSIIFFRRTINQTVKML